MQPIIHFTVSLLVGAMFARGQKRPVLFALACGFVGMLPDLDHFVTSPSMVDSWMHNGYLLVVAPMMLFVGAFVYDHARPGRNSSSQVFALVILALLSGHMALDIAAGNALPVAYPVETGTFETSQAVIFFAGTEPFMAVSDVPLACWAVFCVVAYAFMTWVSSYAPASDESAERGLSFTERFLISHSRPGQVSGAQPR